MTTKNKVDLGELSWKESFLMIKRLSFRQDVPVYINLHRTRWWNEKCEDFCELINNKNWNIIGLNLQDCEFTEQSVIYLFENLKCFKEITDLFIGYSSVRSDDILSRILLWCPNVEYLDITFENMGEKTMESLFKLKKLKKVMAMMSVYTSDTDIRDKILEFEEKTGCQFVY